MEREALLHAAGTQAGVGALQEEAAAITGTSDPEEAAHAILDRPGAVTQWCVVKLGSQGAVLCSKSPRVTYRQHALMVQPILCSVTTCRIAFYC